MSATRRHEARDPVELPRGNVAPVPAVYRLSRTAPPVRCGCGDRATSLVFDARPYFTCGRSKCRPVYAKETR